MSLKKTKQKPDGRCIKPENNNALVKRLRQQASLLGKEVESLLLDLREVRAGLTASDAELGREKRRVEELEQQNDALMDCLDRAKRDCESLRALIEHMQKEINMASTTLARRDKTIHNLTLAIAELGSKLQ